MIAGAEGGVESSTYVKSLEHADVVTPSVAFAENVVAESSGTFTGSAKLPARSAGPDAATSPTQPLPA